MAARALINTADGPESPNNKRAFDIIASILRTSPDNAKARFEYARLLLDECPFAMAEPIPGIPSNPIDLFAALEKQDPGRTFYAILHVQAVYKTLQKKMRNKETVDDASAAHALELAEKLYMRFANHPGVAYLVFRTRRLYLMYMRHNSPPPHQAREQGRFDEFCLGVFNSSEVPEQDKESILEAQLDSLAEHADSTRRFKHRTKLVEDEIKKFTGARKAEFEERYQDLKESQPEGR